MKTLLLSMLLACSGGDADGTGDPASDGGSSASDGGSDGGSSASDGGSDGGSASELNGTVPAKALPAPDFAATNRDGAARDREDLLGHPTVMWFYPMAGTAG